MNMYNHYYEHLHQYGSAFDEMCRSSLKTEATVKSKEQKHNDNRWNQLQTIRTLLKNSYSLTLFH